MRWHITLFRTYRFLLIVLSAGLLASAYAQVVPLPKFNVDIKQTSVSGLSSGGFMAVQFDVAFSAISKGAGVIAGGPYFCAKGDLNRAQTDCMKPTGPINVEELIQITDAYSQAGSIDLTSHLTNHRIWLFSGTADGTVKQTVMNALEKYYQHFLHNANDIFYKKNIAAGHAMPTDFFGNRCDVTDNPFINHCAFDAAGELLKWIYGNLSPPNTEHLRGSFIEFDQGQFIANPNSHSMANTGWAYVPDSCQQGAACRLHIVFHGCKQYPGYQFFSGSGMTTFGRTYVNNTGYNRWADTNNIIVLYPQTTNGNAGKNPLGCWDWFAYDDPNYAKKNGSQMAAVKAMADRVASPVLPAPQGFTVVPGQDDPQHSAQLAWNVVQGASGFNVYRNGKKVMERLLNATRLTDAGLAPGTAYAYQVRGVDSGGMEGAASDIKSITTEGQAPPVPAPIGLTVGNVSSSSVALSWRAASDVAGYNVFFRPDTPASQFTKANTTLLNTTSFQVGGLQPGTPYRFVVRSQAGTEVSSPDSNEVSATTAPAVTACFTASNFSHVQAGRAHATGGFAVANGSNARMGLNNIFFATTLKQTGPNFYVIDNLTCS